MSLAMTAICARNRIEIVLTSQDFYYMNASAGKGIKSTLSMMEFCRTSGHS